MELSSFCVSHARGPRSDPTASTSDDTRPYSTELCGEKGIDAECVHGHSQIHVLKFR